VVKRVERVDWSGESVGLKEEKEEAEEEEEEKGGGGGCFAKNLRQ